MTWQGRSTPLVHRTTDSPVGLLVIVASDRGLVRIDYGSRTFAREITRSGLSGWSSPPTDPEVTTPADRILDETEKQLAEYFAGQRKSFSLPLDLLPSLPAPDHKPGTPEMDPQENIPNPWISQQGNFRSAVQLSLQTIPYGETKSYGEMAEIVGAPRAARAVGSACATCPLPIVLPCHRVTRSDGSLGEYAGGRHVKKALLELERRFA